MFPRLGFALINIGDDGPYVLASLRAGKGAGAAAAPGLEGLGTNDMLLVVRDRVGVPAFRDLFIQKAIVPHVTIRTYNRTLMLINMRITSIVDGPGSNTSPVPIIDATIHYDGLTSGTISLPPPPPTMPTAAH